MAHALVRVLDCNALEDVGMHTNTPYETCAIMNLVAQSSCSGCMFDGRRLDVSSAVPIKPVPGGGCRGDEWRTMKSWEKG